MSSGTQDYYSPQQQLSDALDKLDDQLTELQSTVSNLADIVTTQNSIISNQNDIISDLADHLAELIDIQADVASRRLAGYAVITTACMFILDSVSTAECNVTFWSHPDNTAVINIYGSTNCGGAIVKALAVGEVFCIAGTSSDYSAKSVSGTQYLGMIAG